MTKWPHCGNASVQYFDAGALVGSRRQYCAGYEGVSAYWPHTAYFCPVCGELWGRAVMVYEFDYAPIPPGFWVIERRHCVEHGDGQFLFGRDDFEGVSPELLRRELLVLLEGLNHDHNRNFPA